ncbi:MAG: winged helix-turn-helix transcriptional regulator [Thermoplasmata archaeon]|nr:winged helix-turn-helix transcriptional regulator [Thermoplasmata archaeon]
MKFEIPDDIKKELEKKGGWESIKANLPLDSIKKVEKIMKVLADEKRLKILYGLSIQKMCVCMLADLTSCSYSKCSYHISKLKEEGLIKSIKKRNYVVYSLTNFGKSIIKHFGRYMP